MQVREVRLVARRGREGPVTEEEPHRVWSRAGAAESTGVPGMKLASGRGRRAGDRPIFCERAHE